TLIGTTIIFFALVNVMKLVPYFALGQFSPRTLATSAVLLPFAVATNFFGLWLARRTPTELFYRITYLLMFSDLAGSDLARRQRHSCGGDGVIITSRSRRKRRRLDAAARAWSASMAKITAAAIVAGSVVLCSAAGAFDLQGHRGARGLAPENTLPAFATALSIGVTTLELDLAMTSDGILVVSHDSRLNPDHTRGPDGTFLAAEGPAIRSLTLAQLQRYDVGRLKPGTAYAAAFPEQRGMDGVRIPTLMEVFDLVRQAKADHVRFNIETKLTPTSGADTPDPETFAAAVARAVREAELAARVSIQSFDWRTLAILRRIAPEIERVCLS